MPLQSGECAIAAIIALGISVKRKSVTMILPIKNEGIFIVTLGKDPGTKRSNHVFTMV